MKELLQKLLHHENLTSAESAEFGEKLTNGTLPDAQAAAMLMGFAMNGESEEEIVGLVQLLRSKMIAVPLDQPSIDTCGTGGDGAQTINVSTLSAFVCAAAGVPVIKHGNRAVSSRCGSFDLLEELGVNIYLSPADTTKCFRQTNLAFLFAPNFHPAFKHIAPLRKALGVRTIFNFLGPLLNPGQPSHQLIGVSSLTMAQKLGRVLIRLGSKKVTIVASTDGLDEISIAAPTHIYEFSCRQETKEYTIHPETVYPLGLVAGGDPTKNAERAKKILAGLGTPAENEFVSLNAGMALYTFGTAPSFKDGKKFAQKILASGAGAAKLAEVVHFI